MVEAIEPIIIVVVVKGVAAPVHLMMAGRMPEITPIIMRTNRRRGMIRGTNRRVITIITTVNSTLVDTEECLGITHVVAGADSQKREMFVSSVVRKAIGPTHMIIKPPSWSKCVLVHLRITWVPGMRDKTPLCRRETSGRILRAGC